MEQATNVNVIPADKSKLRGIWKIALYMLVITGIEYVLAFNMPAGMFRTSLFVGLTILKAYYIVSEFMHLGHEVKGLIFSILLPMIFIIWLIVALVNLEGGALKNSRGVVDFEPTGTEQTDPGH